MISIGKLSYCAKERNRRSLFVLPLIAIIIFIPMGTLAGVLNTLCANDLTSSSVSEATTLEFMNWYCKSEDAGVVRVIVGSILPPILLTLWETFIMSFWITLSRPSANDSRFVIKDGSAIHQVLLSVGFFEYIPRYCFWVCV